MELTWVQEYSKGMTINIMTLVFWLIIWLILTNDMSVLICMLHAVISNLFLMYLNWSSVFSPAFAYSRACTNCLNHFVIFGGLITSSITEYSGLNHHPIFLVPSRLTLLPMGSSLPNFCVHWLKLIANGCHEYHKGYCWPSTLSCAHKGLLSLNFWHFLCGVYVQLKTLPLQLIYKLHGSKLKCFSFLKLTMVLMYHVQLMYCPHK